MAESLGLMEERSWGGGWWWRGDERQEPELAFYRERELGGEGSRETAGIDMGLEDRMLLEDTEEAGVY